MGGKKKEKKWSSCSLTCIISCSNIISIFLGKQKSKNYANQALYSSMCWLPITPPHALSAENTQTNLFQGKQISLIRLIRQMKQNEKKSSLNSGLNNIQKKSFSIGEIGNVIDSSSGRLYLVCLTTSSGKSIVD